MFKTVRGPQKDSLGSCFGATFVASKRFMFLTHSPREGKEWCGTGGFLSPAIARGVMFTSLRPKSIAPEGLCLIPHITPGWGDVFGPSFGVYVSES